MKYRKYIEKDGALERRFQTVMVEPPSEEDTIKILKGLRQKYEEHHKLNISDDAIITAVRLSNRYVSGKYQPDKAIDLIDEAGSRAHLSTYTRPEAFSESENRVFRTDSPQGRGGQEPRRSRLPRSFATNQSREGASRRLQKRWEETREKEKVTLTGDDVAMVLAKMTGIPLFRLERRVAAAASDGEELKKSIVGQEEAITILSRTLRRAALASTTRAVRSEPSCSSADWCRQTELARSLATFLFDDVESLIRVDMSEYMEKFAVSRLIGAPPGYVGYEEGGQLTEKVRAQTVLRGPAG